MSDEAGIPGAQTSEFKITVAVMALGALLDGASMVLATAKDLGLQASWLPAVLAVVGSLLVLIKGLGYTRSRTMLKIAAMQPQAETAGRDLVPLVKELEELIHDLRQTPPSEPVSTPSTP